MIVIRRVRDGPVFACQASQAVWEASGGVVAPNGGVMRTSILGVYKCHDIEQVKRNTLEICKVTHADPRYAVRCWTSKLSDVDKTDL